VTRSEPVDPTVVAGVQLLVETLPLRLAQPRQEREETVERDLRGGRLLGGRGRYGPRALTQRARIGITVLVGPEPGALAESAGWLAVPYGVHRQIPLAG
jgi:hypothetical protein